MNTASVLCLAVLQIIPSLPAAAADSPYQPRQAHWRNTIVVKDAGGEIRSLVLSSASYPATCAQSLLLGAQKIEESNGYVWLDSTYQILAYKEDPTSPAVNRHEVVEFKCALVPFTMPIGTGAGSSKP